MGGMGRKGWEKFAFLFGFFPFLSLSLLSVHAACMSVWLSICWRVRADGIYMGTVVIGALGDVE